MDSKPFVIKITGTLRPTCCARCTLPIKGDQFKRGRYIYDETCVKQVEAEQK